MLKLTTINPLGSSERIALNSIKNDFLLRTKKDYNPCNQLDNLVASGNLVTKTGTRPLSAQEVLAVNYIRSNYNDIITAEPADLETHIQNINNSIFGSMVPAPIGGQRFQLTEFGKRIYEIFGYEDHFRTKKRKGIWFAKQLNIKTCPYCNSQYTLIVDRRAKGLKAKFQFDHFYSKKRYPYLSISLYNLVPSCAPCNLSKGDEITSLVSHYHPYYSDLAYQSIFKPEYPIDVKKLTIGDVSKLNIKIRFKPRYNKYKALVDAHNLLYDIEPCYERHSDVAEDLLRKAILYNKSTSKDILKIKGLFNNDKSLYRRYLIGNYGLKDEIFERPLAKLAQDLAEQFELI